MAREKDDRERGFAGHIRRARKANGWTQQDLADESGVGVRTIIRWERGNVTTPDYQQLHAVIDALGLDRLTIYQALGWLPSADEPQPDPVTEELLVLREAVVSILERLDDALERQERGSNESVTER